MPDDLWYSSCCDLTLSEIGAGVIPGGAVSSSGYGDGGYVASISTDDNSEIVAIRIVFISEDDEDFNLDDDFCGICGHHLEECTCESDDASEECENNECEYHPGMCCLVCPAIISCTAPCEDADYDKNICVK